VKEAIRKFIKDLNELYDNCRVFRIMVGVVFVAWLIVLLFVLIDCDRCLKQSMICEYNGTIEKPRFSLKDEKTIIMRCDEKKCRFYEVFDNNTRFCIRKLGDEK